MIKKITIAAFIILAISPGSFGQESINYAAKCREFRQIRKYTCILLLLNSDSTFKYEEILGDLPLVIENGHYFWTRDTLVLMTKDLGQIKYLKKRNILSPQNETNSISNNKIPRLKKIRAKT